MAHPWLDTLRGRGRFAILFLLAALLLTAAASAPVAPAQSQNAACSDTLDNDGDGAIDGADAGCADGADDDEADSPYAGLVLVTFPLPVVSVQGSFTRGRLKVTRLTVRALRGTTVEVQCKGKSCPVKRLTRLMISNTLRLTRFERRYKAPLQLTMRLTRPGQLGKYVRYTLRKKGAPKRKDACLDPTTGEVRGCFEA